MENVLYFGAKSDRRYRRRTVIICACAYYFRKSPEFDVLKAYAMPKTHLRSTVKSAYKQLIRGNEKMSLITGVLHYNYVIK